jgi:hypothetical protein
MSSGGNLVFKGLGEASSRVKTQMHDASRRSLLVAAEHALGVSNTMVPHEEGDLQRSGSASVDESKPIAAVSYDTDYAVKQHEDESLHHDGGRQAKFLETALAQERDTIMQILKKKIKDETGI